MSVGADGVEVMLAMLREAVRGEDDIRPEADRAVATGE
jgi:hypothetical protein